MSPKEGSLKPLLSNGPCYNPQNTSPPSSYKIVPNKIIQHNVTSSNNLMTSSKNFATSSSAPSPNSSGLLGPFTSPLSSANACKTQEDKIKPIIDLVKKVVAGKFKFTTNDQIDL